MSIQSFVVIFDAGILASRHTVSRFAELAKPLFENCSQIDTARQVMSIREQHFGVFKEVAEYLSGHALLNCGKPAGIDRLLDHRKHSDCLYRKGARWLWRQSKIFVPQRSRWSEVAAKESGQRHGLAKLAEVQTVKGVWLSRPFPRLYRSLDYRSRRLEVLHFANQSQPRCLGDPKTTP